MNLSHQNHLSNETLLLAAEGELPAGDAEAHLLTCGACQARQAKLLRANDDFVQLASPRLSRRPARDELARNRLTAALAHEAKISRWDWLRRPRVYLQGAAVATLLLVAALWRQAYFPMQDRLAPYEETGPEPDHALTPGAIRVVQVDQLCAMDDGDQDPAVPLGTQRAVLAAYGVTEQDATNYQVDYLINPQLGGNADPENLWPEPYHATVWNASAKDALETRLHTMVCSGQVPLDEAQRALAEDWIAAYKKYFHAARPRRTSERLHAR